MTEDEMVEWHHRLNGHEFRQTPGGSEGQGSLECCSPWGHKESNRLSNGTTTTTSNDPVRVQLSRTKPTPDCVSRKAIVLQGIKWLIKLFIHQREFSLFR